MTCSAQSLLSCMTLAKGCCNPLGALPCVVSISAEARTSLAAYTKQLSVVYKHMVWCPPIVVQQDQYWLSRPPGTATGSIRSYLYVCYLVRYVHIAICIQIYMCGLNTTP